MKTQPKKFSLEWHEQQLTIFKSYLPEAERKLARLASSIGLTVEELSTLSSQKHMH